LRLLEAGPEDWVLAEDDVSDSSTSRSPKRTQSRSESSGEVLEALSASNIIGLDESL
jgi:hypothetical protein